MRFSENFMIFCLTLVCEVFCDGSCQSCFTVINVAYFIIIKYKLRKERHQLQCTRPHNIECVIAENDAEALTDGTNIQMRFASIELGEISNRQVTH